jgi:hypothetical protein
MLRVPPTVLRVPPTMLHVPPTILHVPPTILCVPSTIFKSTSYFNFSYSYSEVFGCLSYLLVYMLYRHSACQSNRIKLILLTWNIGWAPNNASKWQMGFNLAFKGLTRLHWMYFKVSCLLLISNSAYTFSRTSYYQVNVSVVCLKCGNRHK